MSEQKALEPAAPAALEVLDPRHGELVDLRDQDDDYLGEFRLWILELERQAREAKAAIDRVIHERMDADAAWTRAHGRYKLTGKSPGRTEYDVERLYAELQALVKAGTITSEAAERACPEETRRKVSKRGVAALERLGADVREAIARAEIPANAKRTVKVEDLKPGA